MRSSISNSKRYAPAFVTLLVFLMCWGAYSNAIAPRLMVSRRVAAIEPKLEPQILAAAADAPDALFLGASRFACGLVPSVFEEECGRVPTLIWKHGAYLIEHLHDFPAGRPGVLIVSVYQANLFGHVAPRPAESAWQAWRNRIDALLAYRADNLRRRLVAPVSVGELWRSPQKDLAVRFRHLYGMGKKDLTARSAQFNRKTLLELSRAGWTVIAVRMPVSPAMRAYEDARLPAEDLRAFCESAGATYLDYGDTEYATYDGSHLRYDEALRFSRRLANDVSAVVEKKP